MNCNLVGEEDEFQDKEFYAWVMRGIGVAERREPRAGAGLRPGHGRGAPGPLPARIARSGKLYKSRSRLYRNEILQENMRLKAFAEIYTMHSFALFCTVL